MRLPSWLRQHLAALRALLVLTVLARPRLPAGRHRRRPDARLQRQGRRLDRHRGRQGGRQRADRPVVHRRRRQPARAVLPVPPVGRRRRLRPDRDRGAATSAPRASWTPCPTRAAKDDDDRQARACSPRSAPAAKAVGELEGVDGARPYCTADGVGAVLAVFHRDGVTGPVTRVVSVNQACPATPFIATYQGVTVECAKLGEDYSAGRASRRSAATRRPTRPCPPTRSPPAAAASTRTSARAYAELQAPGSPRRAASTVATVRQLIERAHHRPGARLHGRARRQRARAQPGPRPELPVHADTASGSRRTAMARGQLRVYLGAAPGVGKTYAMLERGPPPPRARHRRGRRVSSRPTAGRAPPRCSAAWRWCPRRTMTYRGADFTEMDVDAVSPARPRSRWSTSWRTPTCPARATTSAGRTSRSCSTPASTSSPPSTSSTWSRSTTSSSRSPACRSGRPCPTRSSGGPTRSSWST